MDLVGDVAPEGVEAETAHAGVDRVDPGQHHGHDVDVPDAGHPQRPTGHAVGVVVGEPDRQVATPMGGAAPRALDEVATGQVVHDVGSGVVRGGQDGLDEVLGRVVDDQVGAQRGAERHLLGAAGDGDDPRPGCLAQLDAGGAEPTRCRVHDERLAALQTTSAEQRQVGGLEREQERGRLGVVEAVGGVEDRDGVGDGVFGDAAQCVLGDGDHAPAQQRVRALSGRVDDAANVHAEGERRWCRHRDQVSPAAVDVVEVEGRRSHLDAHLVGSGLRTLDGPYGQYLARRAVTSHLQGLHVCHGALLRVLARHDPTPMAAEGSGRCEVSPALCGPNHVVRARGSAPSSRRRPPSPVMHRPRWARRAAPVVLVLTGAVWLAACSSGSPASASTTPTAAATTSPTAARATSTSTTNRATTTTSGTLRPQTQTETEFFSPSKNVG